MTISAGVTNIGDNSFYGCVNLTNIMFPGNAPALGTNVFSGVAPGAVVYYFPDTSGWDALYGGLPALALGMPPTPPQIGNRSANAQADGFIFTVTGVPDQIITIEASRDLMDWQVIQTISLSGVFTNFADTQWTNYPSRFYRAR